MGLLALVGLLAVLGAGSITASRYFDARQAGTEAVTVLAPANNTVQELILDITEMQHGVHTYVIAKTTSSLVTYTEASAGSASDLAELRTILGNVKPDILPLITRVEQARELWLDTEARPAIAAVNSNDQGEALRLVSSDASHQAYELLKTQASNLQDATDALGAGKLALLADFANQLIVALAAGTAVLVLGLLASTVLITRWVIRPLDQLRAQLRDVARDGMHEVPIAPSGPPELYAAGQDAEQLRRQLVVETDEARMAEEGLEQEGPVVTAIRAELDRPQAGGTTDLEVFGDLQPAEGVLAGDWWDVLELPDGRTAILITDVSGHGPAAGIAGLRTKLSLTSVLAAGGSLPEAMKRSAALFARTPDRFATCAVVLCDPAARTIEWANAGHLSPLVIDASGEARELRMTGPLLSALGGTWTTEAEPFNVGDVLFMWTDGLSECQDQAGQELGETGLPGILADALIKCGPIPDDLVPTVLADARLRSVDWRRDDVTLIAARLIG